MATLTAAGNLLANNDQVRIDTGNVTAVSATVTGTFVGTITFQVLYDTVEGWVAAPCYTRAGAAATSSLTAAGNRFINTAGTVAVRALLTPYTSGSAAVTFAGVSSISVVAASGGGGGGGGPVTAAAPGDFVDGWDATQGAKADAAAGTDTGTFSLIALFKRLLQKYTTQFPAALDGSGNFKVSLQTTLSEANDSVTGHIGGYTKTVDLTLTRPANVTAYTAGDEIADTTGSAGQRTLAGCGRVNGGTGVIDGATIICSENPAVTPTLKLYIFDAIPATAGDNAVYAPTDAELNAAIGVLTFSTGEVGTTGTGGNIMWDSGPAAIDFVCAGGSTSLYFLLVTRTGFTPTVNSSTLKLRVRVSQN